MAAGPCFPHPCSGSQWVRKDYSITLMRKASRKNLTGRSDLKWMKRNNFEQLKYKEESLTFQRLPGIPLLICHSYKEFVGFWGDKNRLEDCKNDFKKEKYDSKSGKPLRPLTVVSSICSEWETLGLLLVECRWAKYSSSRLNSTTICPHKQQTTT